jgi:excisionase family DNA binding protein
LRNEEFDPLAYIENAFLDRNPRPASKDAATKASQNGKSEAHSSSLTATATAVRPEEGRELALPKLGDYLPTKEASKVSLSTETSLDADASDEDAKGRRRFRKTEMRAPRPRRTSSDDHKPQIDPALQSVWEALPRNIDFLISFYDDSVTANYYGGEFKETREALVRRLLDPELSLEETSRLLGVCPATVRRYTNRGWLSHHRTTGGQRRFRLSDLVRFVEVHGRFPED